MQIVQADPFRITALPGIGIMKIIQPKSYMHFIGTASIAATGKLLRIIGILFDQSFRISIAILIPMSDFLCGQTGTPEIFILIFRWLPYLESGKWLSKRGIQPLV